MIMITLYPSQNPKMDLLLALLLVPLTNQRTLPQTACFILSQKGQAK
jgi:hypothetical protein